MDNKTLHNIANIKHAIDDLKLGLPVRVAERSYALKELQKTESLSNTQYLLISADKANTLELGNTAMRLKKSISSINETACKGDDIDEKIIELAKLTGLLPYLLVDTQPIHTHTTIDDIEHIDTYIKYSHTEFKKIEETTISFKRLKQAKIILFRSPTGREHLVIKAGELSDTPIVRVHSACITGDLFESLKCDCGQQLHNAMEIINEDGGLILYLHQEGRGIGILNKLRAYNLQNEGLDTVQANEMLGFAPDERHFSVAGDILKSMGIKQIKLLTNNPKKQTELETEGITVTERIPIAIKPQCVNERYLKTKKDKLGHWI